MRIRTASAPAWKYPRASAMVPASSRCRQAATFHGSSASASIPSAHPTSSINWENGENTSACTDTSGARRRTSFTVSHCQGGKASGVG